MAPWLLGQCCLSYISHASSSLGPWGFQALLQSPPIPPLPPPPGLLTEVHPLTMPKDNEAPPGVMFNMVHFRLCLGPKPMFVCFCFFLFNLFFKTTFLQFPERKYQTRKRVGFKYISSVLITLLIVSLLQKSGSLLRASVFLRNQHALSFPPIDIFSM